MSSTTNRGSSNPGPTAPALDELPEVLPLFPLTGSLLLPGNWMPLNIFEPRYLALVEDLLQSDAPHLGMIQPVLPRNDNFGPDPMFVDTENPRLYQVGCAGRVARYERQEDGRYLLLLRGVCRFRVREEVDTPRGYRRVHADYAEFTGDLAEPETLIDPDPILAALREFARQHDLEFDLARLETLSGVSLLNGLAVALPFSPGEKQALLEAEGPGSRRELLLNLMGMGFAHGEGELYSPPTIH